MSSSVESVPGGLGYRLVAGVLIVFTALIIIGQVMIVTNASGALSPAHVPKTGTVPHRLHVLLHEVLGSSDRGVTRFTVTRAQRSPRSHGEWNVTVVWSINNDVTGGTVGNGAAADVYSVLQGIDAAHLPIADIHFLGTYPVAGKKEQVVMRVSANRAVFRRARIMGWDNLNAQELWPLLNRTYVNPAFIPMSSD